MSRPIESILASLSIKSLRDGYYVEWAKGRHNAVTGSLAMGYFRLIAGTRGELGGARDCVLAGQFVVPDGFESVEAGIAAGEAVSLGVPGMEGAPAVINPPKGVEVAEMKKGDLMLKVSGAVFLSRPGSRIAVRHGGDVSSLLDTYVDTVGAARRAALREGGGPGEIARILMPHRDNISLCADAVAVFLMTAALYGVPMSTRDAQDTIDYAQALVRSLERTAREVAGADNELVQALMKGDARAEETVAGILRETGTRISDHIGARDPPENPAAFASETISRKRVELYGNMEHLSASKGPRGQAASVPKDLDGPGMVVSILVSDPPEGEDPYGYIRTRYRSVTEDLRSALADIPGSTDEGGFLRSSVRYGPVLGGLPAMKMIVNGEPVTTIRQKVVRYDMTAEDVRARIGDAGGEAYLPVRHVPLRRALELAGSKIKLGHMEARRRPLPVGNSTLYPCTWESRDEHRTGLHEIAFARDDFEESISGSVALLNAAVDLYKDRARFDGMKAFSEDPGILSLNRLFRGVMPPDPVVPFEFQREVLQQYLDTIASMINAEGRPPAMKLPVTNAEVYVAPKREVAVEIVMERLGYGDEDRRGRVRRLADYVEQLAEYVDEVAQLEPPFERTMLSFLRRAETAYTEVMDPRPGDKWEILAVALLRARKWCGAIDPEKHAGYPSEIAERMAAEHKNVLESALAMSREEEEMEETPDSPGSPGSPDSPGSPGAVAAVAAGAVGAEGANGAGRAAARVRNDVVVIRRVAAEIIDGAGGALAVSSGTGPIKVHGIRTIAGSGKTALAVMIAALIKRAKEFFGAKIRQHLEEVYVCDQGPVRAETYERVTGAVQGVRASVIERGKNGLTITSNYKEAGGGDPGLSSPSRDVIIMSSNELALYVHGRRDGGSVSDLDEGLWYGNPAGFVFIDEVLARIGDRSAVTDMGDTGGCQQQMSVVFGRYAQAMLTLSNAPRNITMVGASMAPAPLFEHTIRAHQPERETRFTEHNRAAIFSPGQLILPWEAPVNIWEFCPPELIGDLFIGFESPLLKRTIGTRGALEMRERVLRAGGRFKLMEGYARHDLGRYNGDAVANYAIGLLYLSHILSTRYIGPCAIDLDCAAGYQETGGPAAVSFPAGAPWPRALFSAWDLPYRESTKPAPPDLMGSIGIRPGWDRGVPAAFVDAWAKGAPTEPPRAWTLLGKAADRLKVTSTPDSLPDVTLVLDHEPYAAAKVILYTSRGWTPNEYKHNMVNHFRSLPVASPTSKRRATAAAPQRRVNSVENERTGRAEKVASSPSRADFQAHADAMAAEGPTKTNQVTGNPCLDNAATAFLSEEELFLLSFGILVLSHEDDPYKLNQKYKFFMGKSTRSSKIAMVCGDSVIAYGLNPPHATTALVTPRASTHFSTQTLLQFFCRVGRQGMSDRADVYTDSLTIVRILEAGIHKTDSTLLPNLMIVLRDRKSLGLQTAAIDAAAAAAMQRARDEFENKCRGKNIPGVAAYQDAGPNRTPEMDRHYAEILGAPSRIIRDAVVAAIRRKLLNLGQSNHDCEILPKIVGALQVHAHEPMGHFDADARRQIHEKGYAEVDILLTALSGAVTGFSHARDLTNYKLFEEVTTARRTDGTPFASDMIRIVANRAVSTLPASTQELRSGGTDRVRKSEKSAISSGE